MDSARSSSRPCSGERANHQWGWALVGIAAGAIILHATALGQLLLRRRQGWLFNNGVVLGGIGLLAVSGAAVLTVAFLQLVAQRPLRS